MILRTAGILGLSLLLAGCAGTASRIGGVQYESYYDPMLVRYAARSGEIPVVVRGSPFAAGGDPTAIVAVMRPPAWLADARFVLSGKAEANAYYRVVLLFGTIPGGRSAEAACGYSEIAEPTINGSDHLQAAFCAGSRPVTSLIADGPTVRNAEDPAFRDFLGQVVTVLLPATNPRRGASGP